MRYDVLAAANMQMAVSWVVAQRTLVKFTDVSEVLAAFETSVKFYEAKRYKNPKYIHLRN
jgi:hypothetical protein